MKTQVFFSRDYSFMITNIVGKMDTIIVNQWKNILINSSGPLNIFFILMVYNLEEQESFIIILTLYHSKLGNCNTKTTNNINKNLSSDRNVSNFLSPTDNHNHRIRLTINFLQRIKTNKKIQKLSEHHNNSFLYFRNYWGCLSNSLPVFIRDSGSEFFFVFLNSLIN